MNILMILENSFPPDERVENEINILTSSGHNVFLACTTSQNKFQIEEHKNLTIFRFPISKFIYKSSALALLVPFYFWFWNKNLLKLFNKYGFDVIHLHDLPLIKVVFKFSKKYNIKLVADYHENRPEIMKMYSHINDFPGKYLISIKKWQQYQIKYTPKADRLILVTEEAKDYYASNYHIDLKKIIILPNYVLLNRIRKYETDDNFSPFIKNKFTVVYFGDTGLRRGTQSIINAADILRNDSNIHFLIIGKSKEQNKLEWEIKNRSLKNITLTGWIPVSEAIKYIHVSKVGLCPFLRNIHHDTTYANKMFQYMALGKPVIVSNCTSQSNFVKKESSGLIFEAGNYKELSDCIIKLTSKQLYEELSRNALNCIEHKYNWEKSGKNLIDLYQNII